MEHVFVELKDHAQLAVSRGNVFNAWTMVNALRIKNVQVLILVFNVSMILNASQIN